MNVRESLLRKVASKSDHRLYHHSAIILSGSRFISQGYNQGSKHAEVMAINSVKHLRSLSNCTLISFRVNRKGYIGNSKPCSTCNEAIKAVGINKLIYFDGEGWCENQLR
jgi:tRNA(Arg) A34 adenosine deaminase TadA